jgi:hypothetical protein
MRILVTSVVLAAGAFAPAAWAQYGPSSIVRCESNDGRSRECPVGYARDARLVRQLSRSPCVEGETWGVTRRAIWVSRGCRGEFVVDDRGREYDDGYAGSGGTQFIRCESDDGRWNRCDAPRGRVELVRQLSRSACVRGQTWGTEGRGIWVNGGCRAEFRVDPRGGYGHGDGGSGPQRFLCESTNGGSRFCPSAGRGEVRLVRQVSRSPCVEGRSWGRERNGVWVAQGCRAEFEAGWRGYRD